MMVEFNKPSGSALLSEADGLCDAGFLMSSMIGRALGECGSEPIADDLIQVM
jgi:hypothetical protein